MENQLLPYRPTHKLTVSFKAGGVNYHVVDTDYPIDNNKKLNPQLLELCSGHAGLPSDEITDIKVHSYNRYPKVKRPELGERQPRKGEYWLCGIDGFEHPRVFRREAGGWQIGNEVSPVFTGHREIKPLSRLYTRREVFDLDTLYKLSQRTVKSLQNKVGRLEGRAAQEDKSPSIFVRVKTFLSGVSLSIFGQ